MVISNYHNIVVCRDGKKTKSIVMLSLHVDCYKKPDLPEVNVSMVRYLYKPDFSSFLDFYR